MGSSSWQKTKWGEVATLEYGKGLKDYKNGKGNIPVFGTNGLIGFTDKSLCKFPTVIVGRKGAYRGIHYSDEPFFVIDTAFYLNPKTENLDTKFAYYQLLTQNINAMDSGSAIPSTSREDFYNLDLLLPPLKIQKQLAESLSSLDDKIELNRQMNETLEAMARAIFKSWFVDFDPVYAKMEGRDYPLPADVMDLFPDELEESELGLIPKGWQIGTIEKNIEIQNGFAFKSEDYLENGVFVFRTKNFSSNNYVERLHDDVFLQNSFLESHKKFICQPYDFHVVMVGASVGKTSIIYPNCLPALRNQNMWCFRPKNGFSYKHFVNLSINNLIHTKLSWASGSARDFFRKSDFYNFKIIYPQIDLLDEFEKLIGCIFQKIGSNLSQIDTLVELRETLLPNLIKGEIEIWEEQ